MTSAKTGPIRDESDGAAAFTRVELLVVVAMLALWGMLLLPALARTQLDTRAYQCINNHAQLCRAWRMYADDNGDRLPPNVFGGDIYPYPVWAAGVLDWGSSGANTNTLYLTDPRYSALARYCGKDARLFKCPADQYLSPIQRQIGWKERVRSVAQNIYAATSNSGSLSFDPAYASVTKLTGLLNPPPADTWVSMDEHPDSINDAALFAPGTTGWIDLPANYHDGGAGVAYADGGSEIHRWQSSALKFPIPLSGFSVPPTRPNDPDILWLRYRTPRKPGLN